MAILSPLIPTISSLNSNADIILRRHYYIIGLSVRSKCKIFLIFQNIYNDCLSGLWDWELQTELQESPRRAFRSLSRSYQVLHQHSLCVVPSGGLQQREASLFMYQQSNEFRLSTSFFLSVFHLENKSLPLKYDFNFVIDEISNINDKAQVVLLTDGTRYKLYLSHI